MAYMGGSDTRPVTRGGSSTNGGSSGFGGSGGSDFSLADGFANPLVATALMFSRDGINPDVIAHLKQAPEHPPLDNAELLKEWDPWVRATLVQSALNEGLSFAFENNKGTLKLGEKEIATLVRPTEEKFAEELDQVLSWAEHREERMPEILSQIDNQTAFFAALTGINPQRHPWTFEWLAAALSLVIPVEVRFKHGFGCARPVKYSPYVQPIITTPGHGTYPMGHAAQAYMLADVLKKLLKLNNAAGELLDRLANRISENRIIAGVHFPVDHVGGKQLGNAMATYFLEKCEVDFAKRYAEGAGRATKKDNLLQALTVLARNEHRDNGSVDVKR